MIRLILASYHGLSTKRSLFNNSTRKLNHDAYDDENNTKSNTKNNSNNGGGGDVRFVELMVSVLEMPSDGWGIKGVAKTLLRKAIVDAVKTAKKSASSDPSNANKASLGNLSPAMIEKIVQQNVGSFCPISIAPSVIWSDTLQSNFRWRWKLSIFEI